MIGLDRAARQDYLAAVFDHEGRQITPPQLVRGDMPIIAVGSVTNDFGTPDVTDHKDCRNTRPMTAIRPERFPPEWRSWLLKRSKRLVLRPSGLNRVAWTRFVKKISAQLHRIALAFAATLLVGGCSLSDAPILDPKGPIALAERDLLFAAAAVMLIVLIPVFIMAFLFSWRYRASSHGAPYAPDWSQSESRLRPQFRCWFTCAISCTSI
jgi:hypothetical protein